MTRAEHTEEGTVMNLPTRVGITGAAGFVGSHLSDRLLAEGCEVVGLDDFSRGCAENLEHAMRSPRFTMVEADCTDLAAVRRAFAGCDGIVHLAAEKIPRYEGALHTLEGNVAGARVACTVAAELDARIIFTSTSDVYGNGTPPYAEDDVLVLGPPTTRRWAYAVSKLYDEHLALALHEEQGLRITVLRLFGAYGPRNHPSWWGGPQSVFIETMLDGGIIDIHGDGMQVRTFTFIDDTVDGFVRTLASNEAIGEIINIGGEGPVTILELAAHVHAALALEGPLPAKMVPYASLPGRYQDVMRRIPDITKAKTMLGFSVSIGLEEGLRRSVEWHLQRREQLVAVEEPRVARRRSRRRPVRAKLAPLAETR
jgi:UDP-glucose 4-epimerase